MILSIQSGVVFGAVGNTAAQSVYSALNVSAGYVFTGLFSSPLDVPKANGKLVAAADLESVFSGILSNPDLKNVTHIISGFLGSSVTTQLLSEFLLEVRKKQSVEYLCDPVMGDFGVGYYVDKSVREAYEKFLIPMADYIIPNAFEAIELGYLDEKCDVNSMDLEKALCIVKGIPYSEQKLKVALIGSSSDLKFLETRRFQGRFRGAGDFFSALFLAGLVSGKNAEDAASFAISGMEEIITHAYHSQNENLTYPIKEH